MSHENDESPAAATDEPAVPVTMGPPEEPGTTDNALVPLFTRGGRPGPGRPKGVPNKNTLAMRNAFAAVFEDLQASHEGEGRYPHLRAWAEQHPIHFYKLAVRMLPMQFEVADNTIGAIVVRGLNDGQ